MSKTLSEDELDENFIHDPKTEKNNIFNSMCLKTDNQEYFKRNIQWIATFTSTSKLLKCINLLLKKNNFKHTTV